MRTFTRDTGRHANRGNDPRRWTPPGIGGSHIRRIGCHARRRAVAGRLLRRRGFGGPLSRRCDRGLASPKKKIPDRSRLSLSSVQTDRTLPHGRASLPILRVPPCTRANNTAFAREKKRNKTTVFRTIGRWGGAFVAPFRLLPEGIQRHPLVLCQGALRRKLPRGTPPPQGRAHRFRIRGRPGGTGLGRHPETPRRRRRNPIQWKIQKSPLSSGLGVSEIAARRLVGPGDGCR